MIENLGLKKSILAVLVAVSCMLPFAATASAEPPKVTVVLRYDDYSAKSPIAVERELIEILRRNHTKAVFAVIPFACAIDAQSLMTQKRLPLTPEKIALLKYGIKAGAVEVALHGYSHQTIHTRAQGYSEFAGEQYDTQLRKIQEGKRYLEKALGVPITCFIPPWNHYDENTCKALSAAGIRMLSANLKGPPSKDLQYLPCTAVLQGLLPGVEDGLESPGSGKLLVAQFHHYDFRNRSEDQRATMPLTLFDRLVHRIASLQSIRIVTFSDLADVDLSSARYEANLGRLQLAMLLPKRIRNNNDRSVYLTTAELADRHTRLLAMALGYYAAVILLAGLLGLVLARFLRIRPLYAWLLLLLVGIGATAYVMVYSEQWGLDYSAATNATIGVAAVVGLLVGRLRYRRYEG